MIKILENGLSDRLFYEAVGQKRHKLEKFTLAPILAILIYEQNLANQDYNT